MIGMFESAFVALILYEIKVLEMLVGGKGWAGTGHGTENPEQSEASCGAVCTTEMGNLLVGFSAAITTDSTSSVLMKTNPWRSAREGPASTTTLAGLGMGQGSLCRERMPGHGTCQRGKSKKEVLWGVQVLPVLSLRAQAVLPAGAALLLSHISTHQCVHP